MCIQTLYPYLQVTEFKSKKENGRPFTNKIETWVFDDAENNLKEEAFVLGMTEMITELVIEHEVSDAEDGFALSFSDKPFEGNQTVLYWEEAQDWEWEFEGKKSTIAGNWYGGKVNGKELCGWLCPALLLYFGTPPDQIYVQAKPLPDGINPIWDRPKLEVDTTFVKSGYENKKKKKKDK